MSYLQKYLEKAKKENQKSSAIGFYASIDNVSQTSPEIAQLIMQELKDQRTYLKLIASENYCSLAVQQAMGNLLTDKYSEGFAFHRFYAGCDNVDKIETIAIEKAKEIFGCEHAYVQPHSGADANLIAFWAILTHKIQNQQIEKLNKKTVHQLTNEEFEEIRLLMANQKILGMSLASGGHLTHGFRLNVSAKMMKAVSYDVDPTTNILDYEHVRKRAIEEKPLILLAGYSAYPRLINFAKMREIANEVGAVLMVDMAHFAGLVAGKALQGEYDPVPYADVITSTTHKTLRGPRGGLILCTDEYKDVVNKGCPLVMGGPMPHVMAAKAVSFIEASKESFQDYAHQILKNAKAFAEKLSSLGVKLISGGTDNHLLLLDVYSSFGITGLQAEKALRKALLTVNRNTIPQDKNGAWFTSGIRFGTPAVTTRGMKEEHMEKIATWMAAVLKNTKPLFDKEKQIMSKKEIEIDNQVVEKIKKEIESFLLDFPLYPELIVE